MFKRPEDALDYLHQLITDKKDVLGIKTVGYGTENLVPQYPACIISAGNARRELHSTQYFKVTFYINLWVYHAELSVGRSIRTKQDLKIVTDIVELLHQTPELAINSLAGKEKKVIASYVESEEPGIAQTRRGPSVVTTRIVWMGECRVPFSES